jgi:hypothetical protein
MKRWGNFVDMIYYTISAFPYRYNITSVLLQHQHFVTSSKRLCQKNAIKVPSTYTTPRAFNIIRWMTMACSDVHLGIYSKTFFEPSYLPGRFLSHHHISDWSIRLRMIREVQSWSEPYWRWEKNSLKPKRRWELMSGI